MQDFFFYLFAVLTLLAGLGVVTSRNPVNGAMFMITCLVGMAVLLVLLSAFFLAILQILVYAGAIMVLFLFIIMLVDTRKAATPSPGALTVCASLIGLALLACGVVAIFGHHLIAPGALAPAPDLPIGATPEHLPFATAVRSFGYALFTKYLLPFQVTGILLLVAMVGVIVVSKKLNASGDAEKEAPIQV